MLLRDEHWCVAFILDVLLILLLWGRIDGLRAKAKLILVTLGGLVSFVGDILTLWRVWSVFIFVIVGLVIIIIVVIKVVFARLLKLSHVAVFLREDLVVLRVRDLVWGLLRFMVLTIILSWAPSWAALLLRWLHLRGPLGFLKCADVTDIAIVNSWLLRDPPRSCDNCLFLIIFNLWRLFRRLQIIVWQLLRRLILHSTSSLLRGPLLQWRLIFRLLSLVLLVNLTLMWLHPGWPYFLCHLQILSVALY